MSTTFGIIIRNNKLVDLPQDGDYVDTEEYEQSEVVEIAFMSNKTIRFTDSIYQFLHPDIKVYALDNTQQEIYTVGDIIKEIK